MRTLPVLLGLLLSTSVAAASPDDAPSGDVRRDLDRIDADLDAYEADVDAAAAAPDALRQARELLTEIRRLLPEKGESRLAPELARIRLLMELIAVLVEARALERQADAEADAVVQALERLAVAEAAWQRATEQIHLHALPMPGEGGR